MNISGSSSTVVGFCGRFPKKSIQPFSSTQTKWEHIFIRKNYYMCPERAGHHALRTLRTLDITLDTMSVRPQA